MNDSPQLKVCANFQFGQECHSLFHYLQGVIMEFTWNFDSALDDFETFLGEFNFDQEVMDQLVASDCNMPMDVTINEHTSGSDILNMDLESSNVSNDVNVQFQLNNPKAYKNVCTLQEDMVPHSRSRSNSWPRYKFVPG